VISNIRRPRLISLIRSDSWGNCQRRRENHVPIFNCLWAIAHRLGGNRSQLKLGLAWWICFLCSHTKWKGDTLMNKAGGETSVYITGSWEGKQKKMFVTLKKDHQSKVIRPAMLPVFLIVTRQENNVNSFALIRLFASFIGLVWILTWALAAQLSCTSSLTTKQYNWFEK